jgi:glucan phosphoethanolaminetransferase (alkaline phosphatase superfamily)
MFQILISEKVVDNNVRTKKLLKKYSGFFSNHIISVLILLISIFIVAAWYLSSFSMPQSNIQGYWVTANPWIGIVVSPVLFVVAFALINMIYDCLVVVIALNDFFKNTPIHVNVLNPDRAGGLGVIGRFVANLSYFIALLGLTYSITLISYKSDFWTNYPVLIAVVAYVILAPFVFFAPLWTAHLKMLEFRDNTLRDLARQFNISLLEFRAAKIKSQDDADLYIKNIKQIYELRELIMKFPAWPFNTSAFIKFFGLVYSTLIPGLISVVIGRL